MSTKKNKTAAKATDAKVMAGIDKNLASMATVTVGGQPYTPAQLKAVYQADSDAIDATDTAHAAWQQKVADERTTRAHTALVSRNLRSFLLGLYGEQAIAILGDFDLTAPKSTATTSVATKALAAAKSKATRAARGTVGSVQKKAVVGHLTSVVLSATPSGAEVLPSTPPGISPTASTPATQATPAPATAGAPVPAQAKPATQS
jgi:hypothetical protein